jgi:hypothetical protein
MVFKCVVCLDLYEDKSAKNADTDICASCGYNNSQSATANQTNAE